MTPDICANPEIVDSIENGVCIIKLNRSSKKNALTMPMFKRLAELLRQADSQEDTKAVVLHGDGNDFTAGHDLQAFLHWPQQNQDPVPLFLHALAGLGKPLIFAVRGSAIGIGATMLLHGDWVCCTAEAQLCLPFANLGIGPEAASSLLLPQMIGLQRAKRLLYGGERFSGQDAYDWGFVTELVDSQNLLSTAIGRANELAHKSPKSFAKIKSLLGLSEAIISKRIDDEIEFINKSILEKSHPGMETQALNASQRAEK